MKKSKFSEEKIIAILREADAGVKASAKWWRNQAEVCRESYTWLKKLH